MKKRGFIVADYLTWWIIALGVLVLSAVMYLILTNRASSALEFLKNLLKFGQ